MLSRFLVADAPGWKQKVKVEGRASAAVTVKRTAGGKSATRRINLDCPHPALGSVCYFKKYFLQVLSVGNKDGCKNVAVQEA